MALNQQQLEKEGIYEAKTPLPSVLTDLEQITTIADNVTAQKRKRAKTGGLIILGGILGAFVGVVFPPLRVVSILAIIFGIAWWIYSLLSGGKLVGHRVRLDIAKERIAMIQQDVNPKAPFSVRLALASNPMRLADEDWSGRKNGKQQFFEDSWLSLEGPLLDGTVVTDEVKDLTRKRTYSNPRGRRKSKTRTTYLVNVRFCYPRELYGDARPAEQALRGDVKVAPSATLRGVRVTEKAIVLKALVTSEKEISQTAGMLSLGGYRILNLARRIAAGQRGSAK